jgi:hypothetical protein
LASAAAAFLFLGASILMCVAFPSAYAVAVVVFFALVFVWQVVVGWRSDGSAERGKSRRPPHE